jgi:hypothetical protein
MAFLCQDAARDTDSDRRLLMKEMHAVIDELVEVGNSTAEAIKGLMHYMGMCGYEKSERNAVDNLKSSADHGSALGLFHMAWFYRRKDPVLSRRYFQIASEGGLYEASRYICRESVSRYADTRSGFRYALLAERQILPPPYVHQRTRQGSTRSEIVNAFRRHTTSNPPIYGFGGQELADFEGLFRLTGDFGTDNMILQTIVSKFMLEHIFHRTIDMPEEPLNKKRRINSI